jgi:2-iminobutanoate/2-iminopropanoate deaminase
MTPGKQEVSSADAPGAIGPYSQAIRVPAQTMVFISGQLGIDPASGGLVADTVGGQTRQALRNLLAVVKQAGGDITSVVKTTVYLTRMDHFGAMNEEYAAFFTRPFPARACVAVAELPKGALVQIEAIAIVGRGANAGK